MNLCEIVLPLDERNLAHVLAALALVGIADEATPCVDSRCWWTEGPLPADNGFHLRLPLTQAELLEKAHGFAKSIRWVEGIGCDDKSRITASPHHGLFTAVGGHCGNPLVSYHDQGATSSVFKTFSGHKGPGDILEKQIAALAEPPAHDVNKWLFQRATGVASWKFDARVGGHAYNQGFSANDDGSGSQTPFYPAIEILSIAGAAFFSAANAWLADEGTLHYAVWRKEVSVRLVPLAAAALLDGVGAVPYIVATFSNAYGKGAAYRHFPEALHLNPPHPRQPQ